MINLETIKSKLVSYATKFGEYLVFIGLACFMIYYLMKSLFGSPMALNNIEKSTTRTETKVDNVLLKQEEHFESLSGSVERTEEAQELFIKILADNNKLIQQNNREMIRLRKAVVERNRFLHRH